MKQIRILTLLCVLISGHTWLVMVEADTQQEETFNHQTKEISYWIGELGQGQPGDNNLATKTLIQMGTKVTPYLLEVLQAEPLPFQSQALLSQHWGRLRAAHCLSQLNYGDIVGLLTREIERDPHPTMQHIYAIYLTRHDLKQSIQALVTNLKKANYTLPDIIITLKNINNPLAIPMLKPLLTTGKPRLKLAAAEILIHLGDTSGANLLLSQKEDENLRLATALLLSDEHLESILPILKNGLNHREAKTRLKIINKLADLGQTNFIISTKDKFLLLLDMLEQEPNAWERGTDLFLKEIPKPADEIIEMIGHPDGYDPSGTTKLRQAVIDRWRRRLNTEGIKWLKGLNPPQIITGNQRATIGKIEISNQDIDMGNHFCLTGQNAYLLGAMDGSFPPVGRFLGDEGGFWTPPTKLLDGFVVTVNEKGQSNWQLDNCTNFQHQFSHNEFLFEKPDLIVRRRDFVIENQPGFFSQLTIRNPENKRRKITLHLQSQINIRPAWRSGLANDIDIINYQEGQVRAEDESKKGEGLIFGSATSPSEYKLGGNLATLSYHLELPAKGETSISFLFLKFSPGKSNKEFLEIFHKQNKLLKQKIQIYQDIAFSGVQFNCSDPEVTNAFILAKLNLHMLRFDLRPNLPDLVFLAGYPNYARVFGCDSFYSTPGANSIGFSDTVAGVLKTLADSRENPHGVPSGPVPHEIATSNRLIGIANSQEPPQFIWACWQHFRWTGDQQFLRQIYPICQQSISFLQNHRNMDKDGYVEGNGLIEAPGAGGKTLEATCYLYAAYTSLTEMSLALGHKEEFDDYREKADRLKKNFNRQWWNEKEQMWATALEADGKQRMKNFWSVVFPMETRLADPEKAIIVLKRIQQEWVNQWGGVHTRQEDISQQGSGVVTSNLFGLVGFQYGLAEFGWQMVKSASLAPKQDRMPGGFVEVIPPGKSNFIQLWSVGPFIDMLVQGLGGIEPNAHQNKVIISPSLPSGLSELSFENLQMGEHTFSFSHRRREEMIETVIRHHQGSVPLEARFCIKNEDINTMLVDGQEVTTTVNRHPTLGYVESALNITVPVGAIKKVVRQLTSAN
tara:strand:- start:273 stop:3500 length:3228 start_codon:yes stop_codon:yes gene_type:complete